MLNATRKRWRGPRIALRRLGCPTCAGGRHAEAVIAANSFEQTVARVFLMIKRIIEASPLLRGEAKITEGKITVAGATITAIPSKRLYFDLHQCRGSQTLA